jgi:WD40 repeat protein
VGNNLGQAVRVLQAKNKRGFAQVFSSAASRQLAALGDNVLYIWSAQDGTLLHERPSQAAGFSPDGTLLAPAGYDDKTVRLWNAANGQSVFTLQRNNAVEAVAFSPDGKMLATLETAVDASGGSIMSPEGGFRFWGVR